jgi:DNA-binding Lrp family transcriptional regulator
MELSSRDKRLICLLDQNARRPLAEIAKKMRVSKQSVGQRIKKLRAEGAIQSSYAVINTLATGRLWVRIWIKLQTVSPKIEQEIVEFSKKQPMIAWVIPLTGTYDFVLIYWPRTIGEFKPVFDLFLAKFSPYVKEHNVSIIAIGHDFSHRAWAPDLDLVESIVQETETQMLDAKDQKILKILAQNADYGVPEMGKMTGIDPKTVYYRIKKLEARRMILNYRVKINYEKIGYAWYKFFLVFANNTPAKKTRLFAFLRQIPELIYITEPVGIADLEFEIVVGSVNRMQEILMQLRSEFSDMIKDYDMVEIGKPALIRYFPD